MRTKSDDEKLWEIAVEVYRKAFAEAEPPVDFDVVLWKCKTEKLEDGWFNKHYLPDKRLKEIIDEVAKNHKLSPRQKHRVSKEVCLGCSPSGVKKK